MADDVPDLARAYEPFISAFLAGDFGAPGPDGWTAEMVAAHVALNNECFTGAARAVLSGQAPVYDNEVAVDPDELREQITRLGDRTAIAEWVRRSAQEMDALHRSLTEDQRETPMPTTIRHDGTVIVDEPRPLGQMIVGNATFHLQMHLDQLRGLAAT